MDNLKISFSKILKNIFITVDDIFVCFFGKHKHIDTFKQYLNTAYPNIKFTMKLESNSSIHF